MNAEVSALEVSTVSGRLDGWILISTFALVSLGSLMVYSTSVSLGSLFKQMLFTAIGIGAMGVAAVIPYRRWKTFAVPFAAISAILLILLLVPHVGTTINGGQRWFRFHGLEFQPSELTKLGLTIYFALWLSNKRSEKKITLFSACSVPFGLILAFYCLLIVMQPDLGTAIVLGLAMAVMYFLAGARWEHLTLGVMSGFLLAIGAIQLTAYRDARIQVWLHPWRYATTVGYQTQHALEALGSGGLFGEGLGVSHQKWILPEASTDTIFAVTAEELGLVGSLLVVGLFVLFAWRGYNVARQAPDTFGRLLAVGITSTIVLQAFLNIAVITNTVPFTGVPLPFISAGGSSLVVSLFSVGILLNISREANRPFRQSHNEEPPSGGGKRHEDRRNRWQDRRPRLPGPGSRRVPAAVPAGVQIIQVWGRGKRAPRYG